MRCFSCVPFKIKAFAESGYFGEITRMTNDSLLSPHTRSCSSSSSHTLCMSINVFDSGASRQQPDSGDKPRPRRPRSPPKSVFSHPQAAGGLGSTLTIRGTETGGVPRWGGGVIHSQGGSPS